MHRPSFFVSTRAARRWQHLAAGIACALLFGLPGSAQAQQKHTTGGDDGDEVVRVSTDLVVLNATVTGRRGEFVHGLSAADFTVIAPGRMVLLRLRRSGQTKEQGASDAGD